LKISLKLGIQNNMDYKLNINYREYLTLSEKVYTGQFSYEFHLPLNHFPKLVMPLIHEKLGY